MWLQRKSALSEREGEKITHLADGKIAAIQSIQDAFLKCYLMAKKLIKNLQGQNIHTHKNHFGMN